MTHPAVALALVPLTAGRMTLVWRLFGAVLALLWLQHMDADSASGFAEASARSLDAFGLAGIALLAVGPSLLVVLASAIVGIWLMADVLRGAPSLEFVADEYAVQAGLPLVAAIVTLVHAGGHVRRHGWRWESNWSEPLDDLHARVFRIFLVTTLAFAGLHKLNADFFGPESCVVLGDRLARDWTLPFEPPRAGALGIVVLELLAAAMLLVYPRLGILLVVWVMAGLGHIGPAAFASTCAVMSLAFLDRGDVVLVRQLFERRWGVVAALLLVVLGVSFSGRPPNQAWLKYALLETLLIVVTCVAAYTGVVRARQISTLRSRLRPAALRWRQRPTTVMPGLTSWLALILIVNGLTPYLGVKYRFSTAMLSNLRVDQERWNSYVIPSWVRLRDQTPQTVVVWEPIGEWSPPTRGRPVLGDGLFTGDALVEALRDGAARKAQGLLSVTCLGEHAEFELPGEMLAAMAWARQRPSPVLWQEHLGPGDQPQVCVH